HGKAFPAPAELPTRALAAKADRVGGCESNPPCGLQHQLGLRLAAVAVARRIMGAGVDRIDPGTGFSGHLDEPLIDLVHPLEREPAAADTGLVGDDNEAVSVSAEHAQGLRRAREEAQLPWVIEIVAVDDEGSIAVENDRPCSTGGCHDLAAAATRRRVSLVLCEGNSSARTTLPPRLSTKSAPTTDSTL